MSSALLTGIAELVTNDPGCGDGSPLGVIHDGAVIISGDAVAWVGAAGDAPAADARRDLGGRAVVPGFVDSHSHLVFAGDRAAEFASRMAGTPYDGGGIASTVTATREASDERLLELLRDRVAEMHAQGTTTVEVKSGYGLTVGDEAGLGLRVHGNQLSAGPGVQLAVELGAASVDHCTHLTDADVDALAGGRTVATLLPGVEFSTRSAYPDARRLLAAGVTLALATDCNPGSCYTSSMPFIIALAVREMRMTAAEALWAATAGAARSLRRDDIGVLSPGSRADLTVIDAPSYLHLAYRPGVPIAHALTSRPGREERNET